MYFNVPSKRISFTKTYELSYLQNRILNLVEYLNNYSIKEKLSITEEEIYEIVFAQPMDVLNNKTVAQWLALAGEEKYARTAISFCLEKYKSKAKSKKNLLLLSML